MSLPTLVQPLLPPIAGCSVMSPALDPMVAPAPSVKALPAARVAAVLLLLVSVPTPPPRPAPFRLRALTMDKPFKSSEARLAPSAPTVTAPLPKALPLPALSRPDTTLVPPL